VTTFLALYRGQTVGDAKMVAVTADPLLIAYVATNLLDISRQEDTDPVVNTLERGRRAALRLIRQEAACGAED
jgi:hypothetical protein